MPFIKKRDNICKLNYYVGKIMNKYKIYKKLIENIENISFIT